MSKWIVDFYNYIRYRFLADFLAPKSTIVEIL